MLGASGIALLTGFHKLAKSVLSKNIFESQHFGHRVLQDSNWVRKRRLRAAAHQQEWAERNRSGFVAEPRLPATRGPALTGMECHVCEVRHRPIKCERKMCGTCCSEMSSGPCTWHKMNMLALKEAERFLEKRPKTGSA